jgi:hypothetical protein
MTDKTRVRLELFPESTEIRQTAAGGQLSIGGWDLAELAQRFGTPLYLYDQVTLKAAVAAYQQALAKFYPAETGITYAGKAFLCPALARWVKSQGLWLDCTGKGSCISPVPGSTITGEGPALSPGLSVSRPGANFGCA